MLAIDHIIEHAFWLKGMHLGRVVNGVLQALIKHITHFWSAPEWVICFTIDWSAPLTTPNLIKLKF